MSGESFLKLCQKLILTRDWQNQSRSLFYNFRFSQKMSRQSFAILDENGAPASADMIPSIANVRGVELQENVNPGDRAGQVYGKIATEDQMLVTA